MPRQYMQFKFSHFLRGTAECGNRNITHYMLVNYLHTVLLTRIVSVRQQQTVKYILAFIDAVRGRGR